MTLHNKPEYNTPKITAELKRNGLAVDRPSVTADAFRLGWAAATESLQTENQILRDEASKHETINMLQNLDLILHDPKDPRFEKAVDIGQRIAAWIKKENL